MTKQPKFKLEVFQDYSDYSQLIETRRFNSAWLRAAYMRALHHCYEGDEFSSRMFRVA
jgi:hypothetical protein